MLKEQMDKRVKSFALEVIKLCKFLPDSREGILFENQLFRSAISLGAHYRAACRVVSTKDFASKLEAVEEAADQNLYWLEMIRDLNLIRKEILDPILKENEEIIAILVKTLRSAERKVR